MQMLQTIIVDAKQLLIHAEPNIILKINSL
jgi:hypothetical protein